MSYDFHKLKTVSVAGGEVTLRIPERWGVWPDENRPGYWGCYEKDADGNEPDTGTLWIQVDHIHMQPDGDLPPEASDMVGFAEDISADSPKGITEIKSSIRPVELGALWYHVYDVEEDGDMLRFWFSHYFLNRGTHTAIISMNFVLPHYRMDDPEFVELRGIMEREIGAAFLDPFRIDEEDEAEETLGPLHRCNFDDRVKLVLPEAMGCWPHGDEDGTLDNCWYCRLKTETSHAGLFVTADDLPFAFEEDEPEEGDASAGAAVAETSEEDDEISRTYIEKAFQETISKWTNLPADDPRARRMPWGMVTYEVTDDEDAADEAETGASGDDRPLRNHLWKILCHEGFQNRRVQVLLMTPIAEAEKPPCSALVDYMHRAVRRAEFPGFTPPERY